MARPKKNLPPARTHRITVRLTDEMFDVVTRDAKAANLSNAEYIRQLILKRTIKYAPTIVHDDTKIIQELGQMGKIGSNLNQIARYLNQGGSMTNPLAKELRETLQHLTDCCNTLNQKVEEEYGRH